ncbi:MAG: hypothetical protein DI629_02945 [Mesorhizobium amorphae]|nr:MAG: hypothetical protein DI629_02945 [Mesorhizobium amorphae]
MRTPNPKRLRRLLAVHRTLSAACEARRAGHLAAACAARADAENLRERFDAAGSLFALFPELYHDRVARAVQRASEETDKADAEGLALAKLATREKSVEERLAQAERWEARTADERTLLQWVETRIGQPAASITGESASEI